MRFKLAEQQSKSTRTPVFPVLVSEQCHSEALDLGGRTGDRAIMGQAADGLQGL